MVMICSNCGAENSDTATYCQRCANPLEPTRNAPGDLKKRKRATLIVAAAIIIALVVIIPSVAYVYLDPRYSWDSAIRDHDGDGAPDNSDLQPYDPAIWTYGSGRFNITIHNNSSDTVRFSLLVGSVETTENLHMSEQGIPANEMLLKTINVSWLMGQNSSEWLVRVGGTVVGAYIGVYLNLGHFVIHDGQDLTLSVTYPDDFPPLPS